MPRIQDVQPLEDFASDLCILLNKLINSRMTYRHFLKTHKKSKENKKTIKSYSTAPQGEQ